MPLENAILPYTYFIYATVVFLGVVIGMLSFIYFFLRKQKTHRERKRNLRELFTDFIAEVLLCETAAEIAGVLETFQKTNGAMLAQPFSRKVLIREMVRAKDHINGQAADNLRLAFERLALDKDCFARFSCNEWHLKAGAIQQLAEMQQQQYLVKIYRETNSKNQLVRTEAQIAVVKLTGFKGLRFLNVISRPVSQWQQLALLNYLQEGDVDASMMAGWLLSKNDSVAEFALRLIQVYRCFDLHDALLPLLLHPAENIRMQALHAIAEVYSENTTPALLATFPAAGKQEQMLILDLLTANSRDEATENFYCSLLTHHEEAIRYRAMHGLRQMQAPRYSAILHEVKEDPSFTYILSTLDKKAV